MLWKAELREALRVVRLSCRLAAQIRSEIQQSALEKADRTPVTVADLAIQACVIHELSGAFPSDRFIAEESSSTVRSNPALVGPLEALMRSAGYGLGVDEICDVLDRGAETGTRGRVWTLDPIDGTKGFLRGGQYAVALALLVDGAVELGVVGCPALPESFLAPDGNVGYIFHAVRDGGTRAEPLSGGGLAGEQTCVSDDEAPVRILEAVEERFTSHPHSAFAQSALGWGAEPPLRLDSCCKYAVVARGEACVFVKQPIAPYVEKLWDHAAGALLVSEAGGKVTDGSGNPLDFSVGRELVNNARGIIAASSPGSHAAVYRAMEEARSVLGDTPSA